MKSRAPSYQENRPQFHNETKLLVEFSLLYSMAVFLYNCGQIILYPLIFCVIIAIAILIPLPLMVG